MKIAFDAKRMLKNRTGLGNYSRFMINALTSHYPENHYLLFSPSEGDPKLKAQIMDANCLEYIHPETFIDKKMRSLWRSFKIPNNRYELDLFHGLSNELPLNIGKRRCKSVVTIHDLIYERFPHLYRSIDRKLYQYKYKRACLNADHIVAVSEQTKHDIIRYYKIPEQKISVVYQGCDQAFSIPNSPDTISAILKKYDIATPYVLYVGSIEERKNLLTLVKSIELTDPDLSFVAIGKPTSYAAKVVKYINDKGLNDRIKILHNIAFDELPAFYQGARIFVYPSVFEGFGIPVLEALSAGIPVIGAKGSCLEEAGGDSSLYIEPYHHQQLADYINQTHHNNQLRNKMITDGYNHAKRFNTLAIAKSMMQVYGNTLNL